MPATIISEDPTLYMKNSGIVGMAFGTLQDTFAYGVNKEHRRPLPLKYQKVGKQELIIGKPTK